MLGAAALFQGKKIAEATAALTRGAEATVTAGARVGVQGRFQFHHARMIFLGHI
jgi:hypothetical protein